MEFPLQWQELATDKTLGFICSSEILYVLEENYSILDWTKAKKMKMIFLIKDWECQKIWLSGIWFWEYSGKSVCINNHIKEIFTVLLTTDLLLSII